MLQAVKAAKRGLFVDSDPVLGLGSCSLQGSRVGFGHGALSGYDPHGACDRSDRFVHSELDKTDASGVAFKRVGYCGVREE